MSWAGRIELSYSGCIVGIDADAREMILAKNMVADRNQCADAVLIGL